MSSRIIDIVNDDRYLSVKHGFMIVSEDDKEIGKVPLDDLEAIIANAYSLSYSNNFLIALAQRNVPLVLCGKNHNPVGILWSVSGHYKQAARMDAQIRVLYYKKCQLFMKRSWKKKG